MTAPNQTERDAWNGESGQRWITDDDGVHLDGAILLTTATVLSAGVELGAP